MNLNSLAAPLPPLKYTAEGFWGGAVSAVNNPNAGRDASEAVGSFWSRVQQAAGDIAKVITEPDDGGGTGGMGMDGLQALRMKAKEQTKVKPTKYSGFGSDTVGSGSGSGGGGGVREDFDDFDNDGWGAEGDIDVGEGPGGQPEPPRPPPPVVQAAEQPKPPEAPKEIGSRGEMGGLKVKKVEMKQPMSSDDFFSSFGA